MIEFILHGDDFGISADVNACVETCFRNGWLSETSLMVNMPACDAAVEQARRSGYAHLVGLHLNLTEGVPLTEPIKACPRFCDADGRFNANFHRSTRGRFFLSAQETAAAQAEVAAQLDRFCAYGGLMMRLDSHHHAHTNWALYRFLKPMALQRGFRAMRLSADLHRVRLDKELYKRLLNRDMRRAFETTTHFDGAGGALELGRRTPPARDRITVEVMVHPLTHDGALCDTEAPFDALVAQLRQVPDSTIRTWTPETRQSVTRDA